VLNHVARLPGNIFPSLCCVCLILCRREFCNNVHKLFCPATPFAAALAASAAAGAPAAWDVWSSSFLFLCCMSQQFHAWSHMKKSELPAAVVALQVGV
jgi:ubiquitin-conjugating enzyme E2 variant